MKLHSIIVAALMVAAPVQADEIVHWKDVGGWDISYYPGPGGCVASTQYDAGTAFFIGFNSNFDERVLDVTLMDDRWQSIADDADYDIGVQFGTASPWELGMTGRKMGDSGALTLKVYSASDDAKRFVEEFMAMTTMNWDFDGTELGRFTLRDSRRAFNEVVACQNSYDATTTEDPFAKTDPFAREARPRSNNGKSDLN